MQVLDRRLQLSLVMVDLPPMLPSARLKEPLELPQELCTFQIVVGFVDTLLPSSFLL